MQTIQCAYLNPLAIPLVIYLAVHVHCSITAAAQQHSKHTAHVDFYHKDAFNNTHTLLYACGSDLNGQGDLRLHNNATNDQMLTNCSTLSSTHNHALPA